MVCDLHVKSYDPVSKIRLYEYEKYLKKSQNHVCLCETMTVSKITPSSSTSNTESTILMDKS